MLLTGERIFRTRERLNTIDSPNTNGHIDVLSNRILGLEERIENFAAEASKRYRVLKDNVKKLKGEVLDSKEEREREFEHKVSELLQVERTFEESIETERQARKIEENKQFRSLDENCKFFKLELQREAEARAESAIEIEAALNNDIPKLAEGIKQECADREETDHNIIKKFDEEFGELNKEINGERLAREENDQAIMDMLRDVVNRVQREVTNEKKERQSSEESLLTLLEDTCAKLNNATGGNNRA